jgi:hypothetical protein
MRTKLRLVARVPAGCNASVNVLRLNALSLLFCFGLTGCATTDTDDVCALLAQHPQWRAPLQQASVDSGIAATVLLAIMRHESDFAAEARPYKRWLFDLIPTNERLSSAYGYAQALDSTWAEYQQIRRRPDAQRDDFADAVDFMGWYLQRAVRALQIAPDDARELYLAYHQGLTGYREARYEGKSLLLDAADRVAQTAKKYAAQWQHCAAY